MRGQHIILIGGSRLLSERPALTLQQTAHGPWYDPCSGFTLALRFWRSFLQVLRYDWPELATPVLTLCVMWEDENEAGRLIIILLERTWRLPHPDWAKIGWFPVFLYLSNFVTIRIRVR